MQDYPDSRITASQQRRRAHLMALTVVCFAVLPARVFASELIEPSVPAGLRVPQGQTLFAIGHAVGTQNYICLRTSSGYAWTFFGPQATLFDDDAVQMSTHFLSPNPDENGTPRATWQHSQDTSAVWATAIATSTDPAFVEPGAIPWLLLQTKGSSPGPDGGELLSVTTYIQRVHTSGGLVPATGCTKAKNVGTKALVPYTTDYYFYAAP